MFCVKGRQMTKEELKRHYYLTKERKQIEAELEELRELKSVVKGQELDGMPSGSSAKGASFENLVIRYTDMEQKYKTKLWEIAEERMKIEEAIYSLEPRERMLLRYRYIDHMKWEEICVLMSYSWKQIHQIHNLALEQIKEV